MASPRPPARPVAATPRRSRPARSRLTSLLVGVLAVSAVGPVTADGRAERPAGSPPPMDKLRRNLAKQLPQILSANNCSRVRLDIAVEDGKVRLRAWPVKDV